MRRCGALALIVVPIEPSDLKSLMGRHTAHRRSVAIDAACVGDTCHARSAQPAERFLIFHARKRPIRRRALLRRSHDLGEISVSMTII